MSKKNYYSLASHVELLKSGDDFFKKAYQIIDRSKHKIHFQTYIFSDDETGLEAIKHLADAVKRGVQVYLLVDAFGSHELKLKTIKIIKESGINFRKYSPLLSGYHIRFGRRLHHKVLLCDGKEAIIGGINFDNNYHLKGKDSPWLDYAVYVTGNICDEIATMCERLWSGKGYFKRAKKVKLKQQDEQKSGNDISVKLQQNDWLYRKKGISTSLIKSIRHSQSSLIIVASYFLPGSRMRTALKNASKRNVKVKIVLPGLSDVTLVKNAMSYWYAWMLRNNIELFEWEKTILHGKLMVVDKNWVSIGSYNINHLSHFSSIETNLEIDDTDFCRQVHNELDDVMNQCKQVTSVENKRRAKPLEMFVWWSSFHFVRFLFLLQFKVLSKE